MKAANKVLRIVILIVVVAVVLALAGVYFLGERAVKIGIETAGTKALGVGVALDDVDLSILGGKVAIKGLTVRNPPGYQHENLLQLAWGRVGVGLSQLLGDPVRIKQVKLEGLNLTVEQKGLTNNLQQILDSLPKKEQQGPEPAGKKLRIDELEISDIKVNVKLLPLPGKADTVSLELPPIKMQNLGSDDKLSLATLATKILLAVAEGIARQGSGILPEQMLGPMKQTLESVLGRSLDLSKAVLEGGREVIETGKDALKEGQKVLDATKGAVEQGGKVIEGIKGLLVPKKEE